MRDPEVVSVVINKTAPELVDVKKEAPEEKPRAAEERLEAALADAVKAYIKDKYPQMTDKMAGEAAALSYHFWDDIENAIPEYVKQIWDEHSPQ